MFVAGAVSRCVGKFLDEGRNSNETLSNSSEEKKKSMKYDGLRNEARPRVALC